MSAVIRQFIAVLFFLAGIGPVMAQSTSVGFGAVKQDISLPIKVSADKLAVDQSTGTAEYSGNVVIGQGQMRLGAARVLIVYSTDKTRVARLQATGGVTLVSGQDAAEANSADFDVEKGTVELKGNVLLTQGNNALTSEQMTVDLKDGTAQMSGRVQTVLTPQE